MPVIEFAEMVRGHRGKKDLTMAELVPCPFCGGVDLTMVHFEDEYFVGCYTCDTCGPSSPDEGTAKENWNRRNGGKENAENS